ncbi:MAG: transketolase, partial [Candidatus Dormibacteria bacterium]
VHDPADDHWLGRDRFVLSAGHTSLTLYIQLFLSGYGLQIEDLEALRTWGSKTPGHPEYRHTRGVEITTGPLGQGVGNSVGMAIAQRWLAARFNKPGASLFDYNVYAICSDGDLMEGVANEAASLAGHLRLSNLCWIYDDNSVTIEGSTELAFSEDVAQSFRGFGWATHQVDDANDTEAFARAVESFLAREDRPTLIVVKSVIGYGSPHKQGTHKAHSDPLGAEEVKLTKEAYGWPRDAQFLVPDGVEERLRKRMRARAGKAREEWNKRFEAYGTARPSEAEELRTLLRSALPSGWDEAIPSFPADPKGMATREASGKVLNAIAPKLPWLVGGAADLAPSTKTLIETDGAGSFEARAYAGRNLHFGIREHVMGAVANGLAVSKLRPYT